MIGVYDFDVVDTVYRSLHEIIFWVR